VTVTTTQPVSFTVTFAPGATGAASATALFASNASNSPNAATLTGTGVSPPVHTVDLSWTASSSSNVIGYNVYRAVYASACGAYSKINAALAASTMYTDTSVANGQAYCYVTTAVDSSAVESGYSNTTQAVIPSP
jgi:fibronectin type 3 domain-containing protein